MNNTIKLLPMILLASLACADDASLGSEGDETSTSMSDESGDDETGDGTDTTGAADDGDVTMTGDGDGDGDPSVDGEYFLALSMTTSPDLPLQFLVTVEQGAMSFQPLSLGLGQTTEPRLPVGDPFTYNVEPVNGHFYFEMIPEYLPGEANPDAGVDLLLALIFDGQFGWSYNYLSHAFCGTISWGVFTDVVSDPSPADFEKVTGSTFAAVMLEGSDLPTDIPLSCDDLN